MEERITCFCRRHPLLAVCGVDADGKGYVHVKSYKQQRVFVEVVITEGEAHIRCRECNRWHTVRIIHHQVESAVEDLPAAIQV